MESKGLRLFLWHLFHAPVNGRKAVSHCLGYARLCIPFPLREQIRIDALPERSVECLPFNAREKRKSGNPKLLGCTKYIFADVTPRARLPTIRAYSDVCADLFVCVLREVYRSVGTQRDLRLKVGR